MAITRAMLAVRSFLFLLAALGLLAQPSLCRPEGVASEAQVTWRDGGSALLAVALEARSDVRATRPGDETSPEAKSVGGSPGDHVGSPSWAQRASPRGCTPHARGPTGDDRIVLARAFLRVDGSSNARGARA